MFGGGKLEINEPFTAVIEYDALKSKFVSAATSINNVHTPRDMPSPEKHNGNSIFTFTKSNYETLNCRQKRFEGGRATEAMCTGNTHSMNKSFFESQPKKMI